MGYEAISVEGLKQWQSGHMLSIVKRRGTYIKTNASFVRRFTLSDCERPAFVCTKLARSASMETFALKIVISRIKRSMSLVIELHR